MGKTKLHIKCIVCGHNWYIDVYKLDYQLWRSGKLIQDAFPYLDRTEREILISHMCNDCFPKKQEGGQR